jgi:hypothetical protein
MPLPGRVHPPVPDGRPCPDTSPNCVRRADFGVRELAPALDFTCRVTEQSGGKPPYSRSKRSPTRQGTPDGERRRIGRRAISVNPALATQTTRLRAPWMLQSSSAIGEKRGLAHGPSIGCLTQENATRAGCLSPFSERRSIVNCPEGRTPRCPTRPRRHRRNCTERSEKSPAGCSC